MRFITLLLSSLLVATLGFGQIGNRPVPPNLPKFEFYPNEDTPAGYFSLAPFKFGAQTGFLSGTYLLDQDGFLVWYTNVAGANAVDFKYNNIFDRFTYMLVDNQSYHTDYIVLDNQFARIDSFPLPEPYIDDVHDFEILSNGNYMVGCYQDTIMELSGIMINGQPG
ncbi:MAG: hypothetical protein AAF598_19485, partial [Bacteroidota bacterium]